MTEEELIRIWQTSPNQERIKFEKSRLMIDAKASVDRFHKQIKYRDLREQIAIAMGIPIFAYYAYMVPFAVSKIASVLIVAWGLYVFFKLKNTKKKKPGALSETYLEYLHKTRDYILVQKKLLDDVIYWYILPAMALFCMFFLGHFDQPWKSKQAYKFTAIAAALGVAIYYLNKRAVDKEIKPRLTKIDELIRVMETS